MDTSYIELRLILREVLDIIRGLRVESVYQMDDGSIVLKLGRAGERFELRIVPGVCLYLVRGGYEKPLEPTEHARRLRRFLEGAVLEDVEAVPGERIAVFRLRRRGEEYRLVAELLPRGTAALVDREGVIVECLHRLVMRDRRIAPGEGYRLPPPKPTITRPEDVDRVLEGLSGGRRVAAALALEAGLGGRYAEEAVALAGIDGSKRVSDLSQEERAKLAEAIKTILERAEAGPPAVAESPEGAFQAVPYPLETLRARGWRIEEAGSLNEAFRLAYERLLAKRMAEERAARLREEAERLEKEARERRHVAGRLKEQAEAMREQAKLLLTHSREIEEVKGLGHGQEVTVEPGLRVKLDRASKSIVVETPRGELRLRLGESVARQASRLFDDAKKAEEAAQRLLSEAERLEERAEKLRRGEAEAMEEELERVSARVERPGKEWYERYRWFRTSEGFLAVAGKDASSNRALLKKHLEKGDLVFHAEVRGAPVLVLKRGAEAGERSRLEAAQFAATYSKAWKEGMSQITVYYVAPEQVSLTPPSGHYIPKGGFIVKGERSYLTARLELGFGLRDGELLWGPPQALEGKVERMAVIVPGKKKAERLADEIARRLLRDGDRKTLKELARRIGQLIPYGCGDIK